MAHDNNSNHPADANVKTGQLVFDAVLANLNFTQAIEYQSAAESYIRQLESAQSQKTARRTLARIARAFCGIAETNPEAGSLLSDDRQLAIQRDEYLIEHYPWGRMSKDLIVATLHKIVKDRQEPLSPNTHRLYLSMLKGVAKAALEKKQMSVETYQIIKAIKAGRGSRILKGRALSTEEQCNAITVVEDDDSKVGVRDTAMIEVFISTGVRRVELVAMQLSDFDQLDRSILIHGKGNKERRVWLTDTAYDALMCWLDIRTTKPGPIFCPIVKGGKIKIDNAGLNPQSVNYILKKRGTEAGVDALKPHNLRRTLATEMYDEGINIRVIQKVLGHNNLETTEKYVFSGDTDVKDAMRYRKSRKNTDGNK